MTSTMDDFYRAQLKKFRLQREARTSQLDLSEDLEVTPQYYSDLERGFGTPSVSLHVQICKTLDKPSDCFFFNNRKDFALSPEQVAFLKTLDTRQLKTLLGVLQAIYEENKHQN